MEKLGFEKRIYIYTIKKAQLYGMFARLRAKVNVASKCKNPNRCTKNDFNSKNTTKAAKKFKSPTYLKNIKSDFLKDID